ncbi:hypothetical protein Tco_0173186 [Tanacetum coccineum]
MHVFWSLNEEIMKSTVLTSYTLYPARRYGISVPKLHKNHEDLKTNTPYPEDPIRRIEDQMGLEVVNLGCDACFRIFEDRPTADPDLAKFRDKNLEMYHMYYEQLFRDSVAVGDKTQLPIQFQNNDSPSNNQNNDSPSNNQEEEVGTKNIEGSGDSGEFNLGDGVEISFPERLSSSFELKLDTVLQTLTSRSSQTFPPQNHVPSIAECMDIVATFPGFEPSSTDYHKALRESFEKEQGKMDSDSDDENNDSNEEDWMEDENTWKILNGHPRRCYEDFRLHLDVFKDLCSDLKEHYGLKATRNVSIEESLGIFLMILAHGCGNRLAQETFNHSGETIHRHFHKVLKAVLKLSGDIIKPNTNYNEEVPPQILNNSHYYPMFKNCIGAIDGTHVRASVESTEQEKYIGRKDMRRQKYHGATPRRAFVNNVFYIRLGGMGRNAQTQEFFMKALGTYWWHNKIMGVEQRAEYEPLDGDDQTVEIKGCG